MQIRLSKSRSRQRRHVNSYPSDGVDLWELPLVAFYLIFNRSTVIPMQSAR